jgi:hypothetical protein
MVSTTNDTNTNNNIAFVPLVATTTPGMTFSGTIFEDKNNNNVYNA